MIPSNITALFTNSVEAIKAALKALSELTLKELAYLAGIGLSALVALRLVKCLKDRLGSSNWLRKTLEFLGVVLSFPVTAIDFMLNKAIDGIGWLGSKIGGLFKSKSEDSAPEADEVSAEAAA